MKRGPLNNRLHAAWEIFYRCNYRCPYCFFYESWADRRISYKHVPAEKWIECWDRVYDRYGSVNICISGGEPFIYPGFMKIVAELSKRHALTIVTNLSWETEIFVNTVFPQRVAIHPSLHPLFADLGIFKSKLRRLREKGFDATPTCVGYPPLLKKALDIKKELENDRFGLVVSPFSGVYNGILYPQGYTDEERRLVGMLSVDDPKMKKYQLEKAPTKGKLCSAGQAYIRVHPDGDIFRCAHAIKPMGNILTDDFSLLKEPQPCEANSCECGNELVHVIDDKTTKSENILSVDSSFVRKELIVGGYPYRLRVEISNACNLRCTSSKEAFSRCPQWEINNAAPVLMSFDFFKKIADETGRYLTHAELYNYGEPFMNPRAVDMIRYLKQINPEVIIEMHTNGHYFKTEKKREDIINSGLDILSFSVDGITQEVYEKYRIGGDLETVLRAIRGICALKKSMNMLKPRVIFQFIVFEHNFHEAPKVEEFAKELGADEVALKTDIFNLRPELKISHADIYSAVVGLQSKDSRDNFFKKDEDAGRQFCDFPWVYPTILADGRVVICCRDGRYESLVGAIGGRTLIQVWNNEAAQEFRRRFLEEDTKPYPCSLCECRPKNNSITVGEKCSCRN
ncbi:MAG: radical SAM protein [Candidatus Omnitrophica bacterium]|nr:radical SAM protein [Candidatus Omnitrophota bacterium]